METAAEWLAFIAAWMTMMLGSIPQQDVFQRVTSAKSAKVAIAASILGGTIYFCFTFVPMFIAYAATLIDPALFNGLIESDSQRVLPTLVMQHTPVFAQAIFFGAVLCRHHVLLFSHPARPLGVVLKTSCAIFIRRSTIVACCA